MHLVSSIWVGGASIHFGILILLRHSAARHWLMVGRVPLNVVSAWLGHTNVQATLRIYLPIVGSDHGMENVP